MSMMRRSNTRSKGPLVRIAKIERLEARLRAEQASLYNAPHPHPESFPPGVILPVCPPGCPISRRLSDIYSRGRRLKELKQTALIENARSRMKATRRSAITLQDYEEAKRRAAKSRSPRAELARQLGFSRQGLAEWERKNLR